MDKEFINSIMELMAGLFAILIFVFLAGAIYLMAICLVIGLTCLVYGTLGIVACIVLSYFGLVEFTWINVLIFGLCAMALIFISKHI